MPKRKPIVPMKYPIGQEYAYRRILLEQTNALRQLVKKYLLPIVPEMTNEVSSLHHLPTGHMRQDANWHQQLHSTMQRIAKEMIPPSEKAFKKAVKQIAPGVNEYNKQEWKRLIRSQYGIDPTRERPDKYEYVLKSWSVQNAALIKDIPAKPLAEISDLVQQALLSGKSQSDMQDDIYNAMDGRMDVTDSRAKLIARDQVSKLNGNLTMERQTDAGVDSYVWRTVGDERVRETHADNEGETFQWAEPPAETGHPGEDVNCRCWAEPVLPDVMDFEAELLDEAA